ncbi:hypothetical protein ABZ299_13390 [Streptomyces sp. NPDC006184]|uniref:hypothetical protein n=1 Tax=Streptomyces sp. NPDC006184 TaxID=3155455 RepID=UPI0033A59A41
MGIESDQVVYEYLSRVGDIAQRRQLPSATRMRLVSELRNEIDRSRARTTVDSPAAVRRILERLGTPDEVVSAADGTAGGPQPPSTAVPAQPADRERAPGRGPAAPPESARGRWGRAVPRPRAAEPAPPAASSPPHLAPAHELGDTVAAPDWWRMSAGGPSPDLDPVPGFVGGVEIPELLRRPPEAAAADVRKTDGAGARKAGTVAESGGDGDGDGDGTEAGVVAGTGRRRLPRFAAGWSNPLLLLGAAALIAGAVFGNWIPLLLGWLIAYGSRRLTPAETKCAVLVLPGTAVAAGVVWLWGRNEGRWGEPIAQGHLNDAVGETWPWVVRGAAVATALFLAWRSQRK